MELYMRQARNEFPSTAELVSRETWFVWAFFIRTLLKTFHVKHKMLYMLQYNYFMYIILLYGLVFYGFYGW